MPRRKRCSSTRTPNIKIDVDPDHLVTGLEEHLRQDRSDITTMSGNQDFHHLTPTFSTVPCPWTKVRRAASSPAACPCIAKKSGAGSRRAGHRRRASPVAPAPPPGRRRGGGEKTPARGRRKTPCARRRRAPASR